MDLRKGKVLYNHRTHKLYTVVSVSESKGIATLRRADNVTFHQSLTSLGDKKVWRENKPKTYNRVPT